MARPASPAGSARRVLGILAKWPQAGQVKTRLAADSSPRWAAEVAAAFLQDALSRLAVIEAQRVLAVAPPATVPDFARLAGADYALTRQHEGDLGRRMRAFLQEQLQAGAEQVVLLGTDSPTLPLDFITLAFEKLEKADVVLGPATDGGYYLIGCAGRVPPIFEEIDWGSPQVLSATIARLTDPSWRLALLPPWYDVDTLGDWFMLQGHLAAMRRAGIDPGLPHVEGLRTED